MIAKCVALLAIVAQINAYVCNSNYGVAGVAGVTGVTGVAGVAGAAGVAGVAGVAGYGTGVTSNTRNFVARGKYPIAMDNTGPVPDPRIPVTASHAQAPLQEKPIVRLPTVIPAPRTVAHTCTCQKTILRPRVHDQLITVPSVQRYIETSHTPVVENIHYEACPVNPQVVSTGAQLVPAGSAGAYPLGYSAGLAGVAGVTGVAGVASALPVASGCVAGAVPVGAYGLGARGCFC